jgi:hypothetical protein
MTATKHTSPPWRLKTLPGTCGPMGVVKVLSGGAEALICLFVRGLDISKEEALANATLIQRAPEMFLALDALNDSLYRVEGDPDDVLRVNRGSLDSLYALLHELGVNTYVSH